MKKLLALLFLILLVFFVGCKNDSSTGNDPEDTTYSVSGSVVDIDGEGIEGVTVTIGNTSDTTDAQGNYTIGGLSSGNNYTLNLTKTGYVFAPQSRTISMGAQNQSGENFVGTLSGGGGSGSYTITGRVLDSTGTGITGVTITASNAAQTATDAQGNYTFTGFDNGTYALIPVKQGYSFAPVTITVIVAGGNAIASDIIGSTGGGGGGDGYVVSGRVVDASGAGIPGISITIVGLTIIEFWDETTDANGMYSFPDIPAGSYDVVPYKDGYKIEPQYKVLVVSSSNVIVGDFVGTTDGGGGDPTGEFKISGKVVDSAGNGIPDVEVGILGLGTYAFADTDADGNYSFTNLANGIFTLTPDKYRYSFAPVSVEVTITDADASAADMVGTPLGGENGFTVSGKIVDGAGVGIEGAKVELWTLTNNIEIFTDAQGNYSLVDVPNGTYYVNITKEEYVFTIFLMTVLVEGADVTVDDIAGFPEGSYTVSGRVVDSAGAGVANVMVYLYLGELPMNVGFTNADGYYFLEDVQNQHYIVKVGTAGYTPAERNITVNGADVTVDDFVKD